MFVVCCLLIARCLRGVVCRLLIVVVSFVACNLLVVRCLLCSDCCVFRVCSLCVICCSLFVVRCLLCVVRWSLFVVRCLLLSSVCCLSAYNSLLRIYQLYPNRHLHSPEKKSLLHRWHVP